MYRILVKYPTRQRPDLFLKTLEGYIQKASDNTNIQYLISIDNDDNLTKLVIDSALSLHPNVSVFQGDGSTKIEACNRDIEKANDWDILLLVSDDMECVADGWDIRIRNDFEKHFPNLDGCMWYHDGAQMFICTLSVIGRKYYDRFNYIYHPSYKSFFCDNEFSEIAQELKKIQVNSRMIAKHQHPSWGGTMNHDSLYKRNDKYWTEDELNYLRRKANGWK
jgi:hypothetical protein